MSIGCRRCTLPLALVLAASSCTGGGKSIQNTGSDTMVNLAQAWAETYHGVKPEVSIQVSGGGSGVGISALESGTVDIANASREIEPSEVKTAKANTGKDPKEITVGLDALAVYVHKNNPLESISIEELAAIYGAGGEITKWSQLGVKVPGCDNDEISRVTRQSSSGTWVYFREAVLGKGKEYKAGATEASGSKAIIDLIENTPCAIGYSGMGYKEPNVKWLKVSKKKGEPGVEPSIATVLDHTYPIARKLYMYTLGDPAGEVKAYIDWILSPAGQKIVQEVGYVPVPHGAPAAAPAEAGKK
jgi:phosphate transport system substrate-binding protein